MPDPFLFIVAIIAIACVMLFPVRMWRRRHHRYERRRVRGSVELTEWPCSYRTAVPMGGAIRASRPCTVTAPAGTV